MLRRLQAFGFSIRPLVLGAIVAYALTEMRSMLTEYAEELTIKSLEINARVEQIDTLDKCIDDKRHQLAELVSSIGPDDRYQVVNEESADPHPLEDIL